MMNSFRFGGNGRARTRSLAAIATCAVACSGGHEKSHRAEQQECLSESEDAHAVLESLGGRFTVPNDTPRPRGRASVAAEHALSASSRSIFPPSKVSGFIQHADHLEPRYSDGSTFAASSISSTNRRASIGIPRRAHDSHRLADETTGLGIQARVVGASNSPAEVADGYVVFRDALGAGSHVLHRVTETGYEDFVTFEQAPVQERIDYELVLGNGAAGLRLVGNALEVVDPGGTPRLHVSPPWLLAEDGTRTDARLAVNGCEVDRDPSAPWGRAPVAPGANRCTLTVSWSGAHYPAVLDPEWTTTGSMVNARYQHTMIRLPSGHVFTAGGSFGPYGIGTAELYDPESGTWAATNSMSVKRWGATTTLLEDGTVLVAGGNECTEYDPQGACTTPDLPSAEIYNPRPGTWSTTTPMSFAREMATATRLLDGSVLVTGGNWTDGDKTAEIYEPIAKRWTLTGKMGVTRWASTADRLADGRGLVTGGWAGDDSQATATAELFEPNSRTFTPAGSLSAPREEHSSVMLPNGDVLIVAGTSAYKWPPGSPRLETEVYHPASGQFTLGTSLPAGRAYSAVAAASPNYLLVAAGMEASAVHSNSLMYDVRQNAWLDAGSVSGPKTYPGAIALANSDVLVCGGFVPQVGTVGTCEIFSRPTDGAVCGDGTRAPATEECDLALANGARGTCSASCRAQDIPLIVDSSTARNRSRTLGFGAHPLAGWPTGGTAAAFVEMNDGVPTVRVAGLGSNGVPRDKPITVGTAPGAIAGSDPVIAPIADDVGVVAFTDVGSDGDLLGVGLRRVYPVAGMMGPLVRANARTSFSQFDADVVFTGSQIVVAWADDSSLSTGPDIYYRVFDTALNPVTAADQPLAVLPDSEGSVSLAKFGAGWAAAWRSISQGAETIRAKAASTEWSVGPFVPGPSDRRPALLQLDATHLLVVFTEGTDLYNSGTPKDGRLRLSVLDTGAPGPSAIQDVVPPDSISRDQPTAVFVGGSVWIAWYERAANTDTGTLALKELPWDATGHVIDFTKQPAALPRSAVVDDRRRPVLGGIGATTLLAAWDDVSRVFGTSKQKGDVMISALPLPLRRLP